MEELKQNRKIRIRQNEKTEYALHSKPYNTKRPWWLQCNDNLWYDSKTKKWVTHEHTTKVATVKSVKSLVRHLRKQYLPKGITFTLAGSYVGEVYTVYID
jgi:hypothetical protein